MLGAAGAVLHYRPASASSKGLVRVSWQRQLATTKNTVAHCCIGACAVLIIPQQRHQRWHSWPQGGVQARIVEACTGNGGRQSRVQGDTMLQLHTAAVAHAIIGTAPACQHNLPTCVADGEASKLAGSAVWVSAQLNERRHHAMLRQVTIEAVAAQRWRGQRQRAGEQVDKAGPACWVGSVAQM